MAATIATMRKTSAISRSRRCVWTRRPRWTAVPTISRTGVTIRMPSRSVANHDSQKRGVGAAATAVAIDALSVDPMTAVLQKQASPSELVNDRRQRVRVRSSHTATAVSVMLASVKPNDVATGLPAPRLAARLAKVAAARCHGARRGDAANRMAKRMPLGGQSVAISASPRVRCSEAIAAR